VRIQAGDTQVDCARREVCYADGNRAPLSVMEAGILERLAAHAGRAVSREELLSCVWGLKDGTVETRAIDMHITRLRQKLAGEPAEDPPIEWIVTVRGKGYMLAPDIQVVAEDAEEEASS
jgi:DNA-binding response OmpR family regulator